ncbi:uncharacterized protein N7458_008049 [Penicillium daleae]|uniref:Uncharacterized protein n=1 Tax=Penicillium daleae TaxID=63821 RepID=A0AAD6G0I6_9EURO|nr:uncharacterized protein N7458_008049 [Penicillium daleae]KAJ5444177.1 hypothetical protein N7458_008049 [Penicillium daleae]
MPNPSPSPAPAAEAEEEDTPVNEAEGYDEPSAEPNPERWLGQGSVHGWRILLEDLTGEDIVGREGGNSPVLEVADFLQNSLGVLPKLRLLSGSLMNCICIIGLLGFLFGVLLGFFGSSRVIWLVRELHVQSRNMGTAIL